MTLVFEASIRSLQQYVLVSYRESEVEIWTRGIGDVWTSAVARDGVAPLTAIDARLDVRELYDAAADPNE